MAKYYVCVEASPNNSMMSMMGGGFDLKYYEVEIEPPVNAQRIYDIIKANSEHEPGNVVAWSKIEEL